MMDRLKRPPTDIAASLPLTCEPGEIRARC